MARARQDTRHSTATSVPTYFVDQDDEAHWINYQRWETVEHEEAHRSFRAGKGQITELPPMLAAPPVKTRYSTTDVTLARSPGPPTATPPFVEG
jgi:quinol monooxygenase YgiN